MQHVLKKSHYIRCPALKLLCNSLCDPLTKKFADLGPNKRFATSQACFFCVESHANNMLY